MNKPAVDSLTEVDERIGKALSNAGFRAIATESGGPEYFYRLVDLGEADLEFEVTQLATREVLVEVRRFWRLDSGGHGTGVRGHRYALEAVTGLSDAGLELLFTAVVNSAIDARI